MKLNRYQQAMLPHMPPEWEMKTIGDLVIFAGGSQPPSSSFRFEPEEGYVRLIQIRDFKTEKYATYIPKSSTKKFCESDDVMIGRYGPPNFQIMRGLTGAYNVALIKATPKTPLDKEYLYYFLKQDHLFHFIDVRAQRTAGQDGIEMDELRVYPFPLPPAVERKKIVELLTCWDRAIELTEKLIAAKQKRKQALMQQLLAGKVRFKEFVKSGERFLTRYGDYPKDWKYVRLEKVAQEVSERNIGGTAHQVLSCTKYDGLVDSLTYFGKQIFSDDLSTYKIVGRNHFAYATNHIEEGSIGYQNVCDVAVISPMYTVFKTKDGVDDGFLYKLLKSDLYVHIYQVNTSASVDRRGSLRWEAFSHIRIALPSIEEQRAIAAVLDCQQREIKMLTTKCETLKQQKKGLMQQLLTGKIRVNGDSRMVEG